MSFDLKIVDNDVLAALKEDIGSGDVTGELLDAETWVKAKLVTRESFTLAGRDWFERSFMLVDESVTIEWFYKDGQDIDAGNTVALIVGNARSVMTAERTAINFMQTLSGVATNTKRFVSALNNDEIKLLDTRKTIPKLRFALKYAVTCGGGVNHRMGLYDAFLIKENHIRACGGIKKAIEKAKSLKRNLKIEVEVESLAELNEALLAKADVIMLDNFSNIMIKEAVELSKSHDSKLEVSGGISLETIANYNIKGVDYISVGDLTKSVSAVDFSLQVTDSYQRPQ